MFLITPIANGLQTIGVFSWDFVLTFLNLVTPKLKVGHVTPQGHPGAGGKWPEYIAPKDGDSRCACPALNAMANHGS
jgi:Peroxidase, family 2